MSGNEYDRQYAAGEVRDGSMVLARIAYNAGAISLGAYGVIDGAATSLMEHPVRDILCVVIAAALKIVDVVALKKH